MSIHDGEQHYNPDYHLWKYHQNPNWTYAHNIWNDRLKERLCMLKGINLIRVRKGINIKNVLREVLKKCQTKYE